MRYDTPLVYTGHNAHRCLQQTRVNKQMIKSLAPRIMALSASLCEPVSEGDYQEERRRKRLER